MKKELLNYSGNVYPLHMPGHKLGRLRAVENVDLYKIDTTEVKGTDNLFMPEGIIKEAMNYAKGVYHTVETLFLVNGSSCGILAAISGCCQKGSSIIVGRNSHHSVYNAIYLNELEPVYVYPEMILDLNIAGGINPKDIEEALANNKAISTVIITSPTYEGLVLDIENIAKIVHQYNKILIVDEAHGAHFNFSNFFPKSALELGADIVIQSLHKTLPAFTQSALLHINSERVNILKVKRYLKIYQTSSPSYILMTGIDETIKLTSNKAIFKDFASNIRKFRRDIDKLDHIGLVGKAVVGKKHIVDIDQSKLLFVGKEKQIDGNRLESILRYDYQIQLELSTVNSCLGITTIADDYSIFDQLLNAFKLIDFSQLVIENQSINIVKPINRAISIYDGVNSETEEIDVANSINRVCGDYIMLYPPSIPILVPGEIIREDIIEVIKKYKAHNLTVHGIKANKIKVIKEGI